MKAGTRIVLAVAAGSALGSLARLCVSVALAGFTVLALPWATLLANVAGSVLVGFIAGSTRPERRLAPGPREHFLITGFCAGFTTFSAFSLETITLAADGLFGIAALYLALSLITWLPGAWAGLVLGRRYTKP